MQEQDVLKIRYDLHFPEANNLLWYVGIYLGLPRVFMSIVRRKVIQNSIVESVLIPQHVVCDPITGRKISISITDRYFFIGTKRELFSEEDIGVQTHLNSVMLLRNGDNPNKPSMINTGDIKNVIREYLQKRKTTIQPDLTVLITDGTFRDWYGTVEGISEDREQAQIRFSSDEYNCVTEIPTVLCRVEA